MFIKYKHYIYYIVLNIVLDIFYDGYCFLFIDMESFLELFDPDDNKHNQKDTWNDSENEGNRMSDCENSSNDDDQEERLPPEPEQGNVEYKLKLINPSSQRFEHLVTQMKWRLREGHGEAIYQIGMKRFYKL